MNGLLLPEHPARTTPRTAKASRCRETWRFSSNSGGLASLATALSPMLLSNCPGLKRARFRGLLKDHGFDAGRRWIVSLLRRKGA